MSQVSWIRRSDGYPLYIGDERFINDKRFELISTRLVVCAYYGSEWLWFFQPAGLGANGEFERKFEEIGVIWGNLRGNNSEWSQPGRKPHNWCRPAITIIIITTIFVIIVIFIINTTTTIFSTWCKLEPRDPCVLPRALFNVLLGPADWNSRICLGWINFEMLTILTIVISR